MIYITRRLTAQGHRWDIDNWDDYLELLEQKGEPAPKERFGFVATHEMIADFGGLAAIEKEAFSVFHLERGIDAEIRPSKTERLASGNWIGSLSKHIKATAPADRDPLFPTNLTPEEEALGFRVITIEKPTMAYAFESSTIEVAILDLADGLRAVKCSGLHGATREYAIWNEANRPVANPVYTLIELKALL